MTYPSSKLFLRDRLTLVFNAFRPTVRLIFITLKHLWVLGRKQVAEKNIFGLHLAWMQITARLATIYIGLQTVLSIYKNKKWPFPQEMTTNVQYFMSIVYQKVYLSPICPLQREK